MLPDAHQTHRQVTPKPDSLPLVEASHVGVKFMLGWRRDDIQSLTYKMLLGRGQRQERWALKDVSFLGFPGDIVGLVGSNGAGKTTFCRVLAGLLRPDTGALTVRGEISALLSLGTGFNGQLSGRENIYLNGLMLGLTKREMRRLLPEIVTFSGLGRFIDEPLKHYSNGMRARLGFSIAAMLEPEVLILDETLSVGDLEFTERAARKMQQLMRHAKMVILVSHQLDYVERHCTRVLWLDRGTVRAMGRPDEVLPLYRELIPKRRRIAQLAALHTDRPRSSQPDEVVATRHASVKFALLQATRTAGRRVRGELWALNDVSLTVHEGEVVGIIGPNGAGKSTLCRLLTGILTADRGTIAVRGKVSALLALGAGFNVQLSGADNIYLNGMMLGMPKRRVRDLYAEIVEFSGLAAVIHEPVKHYSAGMRARLGFSIAATVEPDILIIDEVLSAGDAAFYEQATARIHDLMTSATAVIVVTHNLMFVETVCTRAIWLHEGHIKCDGAPGEIVARYRQARRASVS